MRRWAGWAVTLAASALAFVLLRRSLPDPGTLVPVLASADWWWLGSATLLQVGSLIAYARQQQWLLAGLGGAMSLRRAVAVSLARTTLSSTMPAGGPLSTAFAVRQFGAHGVTGAAALAAVLLASLQASAATLLVYLGWWAVDVPAVAAALALLGWAAWIVRKASRRPTRPPGAMRRWARACASLSRRDWLRTGGAAVARRLFDLACLVAVAQAFGINTGTMPIVGAYLAGLLVRQIPLAAGGAGLVEASLLAFLLDAGADAVAAAALVLVYRVLSCWLVAVAGLPALIGLGAASRRPGYRTASKTRSDSTCQIVSTSRKPASRSAAT